MLPVHMSYITCAMQELWGKGILTLLQASPGISKRIFNLNTNNKEDITNSHYDLIPDIQILTKKQGPGKVNTTGLLSNIQFHSVRFSK